MPEKEKLSTDAMSIIKLDKDIAKIDTQIADAKLMGADDNKINMLKIRKQKLQDQKKPKSIKIAKSDPEQAGKVLSTDAVEYLDGIIENSPTIAGLNNMLSHTPDVRGGAFGTDNIIDTIFGYKNMPKKIKTSQKKSKEKTEASTAGIVSGPVSAGGVGGIHKRKIGEGPSKPGKYKAKGIYKRTSKKKKNESVDVNNYVDNLLD